MISSNADRLIDQARRLAEEVMELHVLSVRMGAGQALPEDYRTGSRIIANADALAADIDRRHEVAK